ncbi:hypothetical protein LguiB_023455 [Lonicera macranthoides]
MNSNDKPHVFTKNALRCRFTRGILSHAIRIQLHPPDIRRKPMNMNNKKGTTKTYLAL